MLSCLCNWRSKIILNQNFRKQVNVMFWAIRCFLNWLCIFASMGGWSQFLWKEINYRFYDSEKGNVSLVMLELSINYLASYRYILKEFYIKRVNKTFHNYLCLFLSHACFKNSRTFCSSENCHRVLNIWSRDLKDTDVSRSDIVTPFFHYFWQIHFPHGLTIKWLRSSLIILLEKKRKRRRYISSMVLIT